MPTLPTFDVTAAMASRLLDAFDGQVDQQGVAIPPAKAYKMWLKNMLIQKVQMNEAQRNQTSLNDGLVL